MQTLRSAAQKMTGKVGSLIYFRDGGADGGGNIALNEWSLSGARIAGLNVRVWAEARWPYWEVCNWHDASHINDSRRR